MRFGQPSQLHTEWHIGKLCNFEINTEEFGLSPKGSSKPVRNADTLRPCQHSSCRTSVLRTGDFPPLRVFQARTGVTFSIFREGAVLPLSFFCVSHLEFHNVSLSPCRSLACVSVTSFQCVRHQKLITSNLKWSLRETWCRPDAPSVSFSTADILTFHAWRFDHSSSNIDHFVPGIVDVIVCSGSATHISNLSAF